MSSNFIKYSENFYKSEYSGIKVYFKKGGNAGNPTRISLGTPNYFDLAHIIEHLVFFGSKNFPNHSLYSIANNFYGTIRARTSPNITSYSFRASSEEGYYELLPIILDALFNPLFLESFYKSEVYYIDDEGYENGRIYNEMRDKYFSKGLNGSHNLDKSDSELMNLSNKSSDYIPSLDDIKEYHKQYYRLDNCIIMIHAFNIDLEKVFSLMENFEKKNCFFKRNVPIPRIGFQMNQFTREIKFIDVPNKTNHGRLHMLWKTDKISTKNMQKLYEILKNKSYLIDEKLRDIGTNGTTIVYYEYDTIPYIFGYSLRKLNFSVMTKSVIEKLIEEMIEIIMKTPIDTEKLKQDSFDSSCYIMNFVNRSTVNHLTNDLDEKNKSQLDEEYKDLMKKYLTKEYTVVFFKPREKMDEEQRERELEMIKERKLKRNKKEKEELSNALRMNHEFFKNESKHIILFNQKEIISGSEVFNHLNIERIIVEDEEIKGRLNIPVEYYVDKRIFEEFIKLELFFDLSNIDNEYYGLLMLFFNIKKNYHKHLMKIKDRYLVVPIHYDYDDNGETAKYLKEFINSWCHTHCIRDVLMSLIREGQKERIDTFYDTSAIYHQQSVERYTKSRQSMLNIHSKLFDLINDEEILKNFEKKLMKLNKMVFKCDAHLKVYIRDRELINKIDFTDWPKFKNSVTSLTKDVSQYNIGQKYCILNLESSQSFLKRYLPLELEENSDIHLFVEFFNHYLSETFIRHDCCEGTSYTTGVFFLDYYEPNGLCYYINRTSNPLKTQKQHKDLVKEIIENKNGDLFHFELAKRGRMYSRSKNERLKNVTLEELIDKVGRYYLDLFDDEKSVLMISIPESYRDRIDDDEIQFIRTDDLMMHCSFNWLKDDEKENIEAIKTDVKK